MDLDLILSVAYKYLNDGLLSTIVRASSLPVFKGGARQNSISLIVYPPSTNLNIKDLTNCLFSKSRRIGSDISVHCRQCFLPFYILFDCFPLFFLLKKLLIVAYMPNPSSVF